jgi:ADP-ribose pyrophosphatase
MLKNKNKKMKIKNPVKTKAAAARQAAIAQPRRLKLSKAKKRTKTISADAAAETAQVLRSQAVYQGPLFRVLQEKIIEPGGKRSDRDVIRHNGSVVMLALDNSKNKKDPWVVIERQYRHAASQLLWELPAGTLEPGEDPLAGAQRELAEETGYTARKWRLLLEYYASPGFLGESMKVFVAEGLTAGEARPEDDEQIELRLVKLSDLLKMIEKGAILDGKTLASVLLYARLTAGRSKN